MTSADRPVVIVSNRGPVRYERTGDGLVARRGSGGLVSGLAPLVGDGDITWIAAALGEEDREAAAAGPATEHGMAVRLLALDREDHRLAYDVVSNETLWFVHHGLFDQVRVPAYDDAWWEAWAAYRRVNEAFADAVCDDAPQGAAVLVQDYHLALLAPTVRRRRPDLALVHFHHTPFAGPDGLRVLPPAARVEMLRALAAHDACGFHTEAWADNFRECLHHDRAALGDGPSAAVVVSSLASDPGDLTATATSERCEQEVAALRDMVDGRRLLVRVDRMELSKNIARGFAAFDLLLERRPDLRAQVVFLACCYPSREGVAGYARYRREVEEAAAAVNDRWGTPGWQPVVLETDDDFPRSVAALRSYDVLVVNPIRDGLNLVAKEGPLVNERDGQLVLSTEAGVAAELGDLTDPVHPFDLCATADAMAAALDRPPAERAERAAALRRRAAERTPADWLADQLAAAG